MLRRSFTDLRRRLAASDGCGDLAALHGIRGLLDLKNLDQLVDKQRNYMQELVLARFGRGPFRHLCPTAVDQLAPVFRKENMQHEVSILPNEKRPCLTRTR